MLGQSFDSMYLVRPSTLGTVSEGLTDLIGSVDLTANNGAATLQGVGSPYGVLATRNNEGGGGRYYDNTGSSHFDVGVSDDLVIVMLVDLGDHAGTERSFGGKDASGHPGYYLLRRTATGAIRFLMRDSASSDFVAIINEDHTAGPTPLVWVFNRGTNTAKVHSRFGSATVDITGALALTDGATGNQAFFFGRDLFSLGGGWSNHFLAIATGSGIAPSDNGDELYRRCAQAFMS